MAENVKKKPKRKQRVRKQDRLQTVSSLLEELNEPTDQKKPKTKRKQRVRKQERRPTVSSLLEELNEPTDSPQSKALAQSLIEKDWKHVVHLLLEYEFSDQLTDFAVKSFHAANTHKRNAKPFHITSNLDVRNACDDPSVLTLYISDNPKSCATILAKLCLLKCVDRVLRCGFLSSVDCNTVITEASKNVDSEDFMRYLLPHCDESQLASLLPRLVEQGLWPVVGKALNGCVTEEQLRHAVEQAAKNADASDLVTYILPRCTDSQIEVVLPHLLSRSLWEAVGYVLGTGISETRHTCIVADVVTRAKVTPYIDYILPRCSESQIESYLVNLVAKKDWRSIRYVLQKGVRPPHAKAVLKEALDRKVKNRILTESILPYCRVDLFFVLQDLIRRSLWEYVAVAFHSQDETLPEKDKDMIIFKTCKEMDDHTIQMYILDHCSQSQLESVLPILVSRNLWNSVGSVLKKGVRESLFKSTVENAFEKNEYGSGIRTILPSCPSQLLFSVLPLLIKLRLWDLVREAFEAQSINIDEATRIAFQKIGKGNYRDDNESVILSYVLKHCSKSDMKSILPFLLSYRKWKAVAQMLSRDDICSNERMDVLVKLVKYADFTTISELSDDQLRQVLPHLLLRDCNQCVSRLVEHGVCDEMQVALAVVEACEMLEQDTQKQWIHTFNVEKMFSQCSNCQLAIVLSQISSKRLWSSFNYVLPNCSVEQLMSVFTHLVSQGQWKFVGKVLERGVSDTHCRYAVEQAAANASDVQFMELILPRCIDTHLVSVFSNLVERGLWKSVSKVLERGVNDEYCRYAVEQGAANSRDDDFTECILPHCSNDQLVPALPHLVSRDLWKSVGKVLGKGLNDTESRSAFETTIMTAHDYALSKDIIPYISDDQCCYALSVLAERKCWSSVFALLKKEVCYNETIRNAAIEKICQFSSDFDVTYHLLPLLGDADLNFVMPLFVSRGLWRSVSEALKRGVSASLHISVVKEALGRNQECFLESLLSCPVSLTDELCSLVPSLMEESQKLVAKAVQALCKAGNTAVIRVIVEEGFKNWKARDTNRYILDSCNDSQLEFILPQLVSHNMWKYVDKVLTGFDSDNEQDKELEHKEAILTGLERANNSDLIDFILPHCTDSQLNSLLPDYIAKGLWGAVHIALERNVCGNDQHRLAVREGSLGAKEDDFIRYILPHCTVDDIKFIFDSLVSRGMWETVGKIICQHDLGSEFQCHIAHAIEEARASQTDFLYYILPLCKKTQCSAVLTNVLNKGMLQEDQEKDCQKPQSNIDLKKFQSPSYTRMELVSFVFPCLLMFRRWSLLRHYIHNNTRTVLDQCLNNPLDFVFWGDVADISLFWLAFKQFRVHASEQLASHLASELTGDTSLVVPITRGKATVVQYNTLSACIMFILCYVICAGDRKSVEEKGRLCSHIYKAITDKNVFIHRSVLENIFHRLSRQHVQPTHVSIQILSALTLLFPEKQDMLARQYVMHEANVSFFKQVMVSQLGEHDRRMLFHAAVKQKQWIIVKKWGDHMLYDDQRWWALDEAYKEKQWDVMLHLTEHGLTELEVMKVNNRLMRFADWSIQLRMLQRGVDIAEIKAILLQTLSKNAQQGISSPVDLENKLQQILKLEDKLKMLKFERHGMSALKGHKWRRVFYFAQRSIGQSYKLRALKAAIESKAWHVVIPLIRLGIDSSKHDSLFTGMMKRRQWDVCSALLEKGVSVQLCLYFLSELMVMNQWTIVARVMEFNVGDAVRQLVMQRALESREGSVVWRCISTMDHYQLSEDKRIQLFKRAFCSGMWQAVKPLIEFKDNIGIQHRDTAMLAAMEQRLWDVVDYCQLHDADVDMEDEAGETAVNRAAKKQDWEAVEELLVRGSDPNHLDKDGNSVLRSSIEGKSWSTVKLAIEYHGDVHEQINRDYRGYNNTPLKILIEKRQGELIDHTLIWCPDQKKAVTEQGETTLHAIAASGCDSSMYFQVARGVNPFVLTRRSLSVLAYSVYNEDCPQKKVAECIKAGLCTYQPSLTNLEHDYERLDLENLKCYLSNNSYRYYRDLDHTSPFLVSVIRALITNSRFTLARMLYESGSVSNDELFRLYNAVVLYEMKALSCIPLDEDRLPDEDDYDYENRLRSMLLRSRVEDFLPIIQKMVTMPRSLMSSCRLVISHSLSPRHHHQRHIARLLLSPQMKDYVMFTDLADPDYGKEKRPRFDHMASLKAAIRKMEEEELKGAAGGPANKQGLGKNDEHVPAEPETLLAAEEEDEQDDEEEAREEEDESDEEEESDDEED